jgi:YfiH family protein
MTNTNFIQPNWPAPHRIKAYTSLRPSGLGMQQQNLAAQSSHADKYVDHARLKTLLDLPSDPIWIDQVHGTTVLQALPESINKAADATFTHETNRISAILTADCLPLLVCHRQGTHVAAIHAGWRGLANGIIGNTVQALNLPSEELLVWLGPAIGPTQFEIRKDVYDAFVSQDPATSVAFQPVNAEQWLADLYTLARIQLKKLGITHIYGGEFCTYSNQAHFFSYRRYQQNPTQDQPGRIISLIWIANSG